MSSFYGGISGASFVLVKNYLTIEDMVADFKLGGEFTEVGYGEYVLIDTLSKNNSDNGKLYMRGMDYTNTLGGAIYKGQLVGPKGDVPELTLAQQDEIDELVDLVESEGGHATGKAVDQPWETVPGYNAETGEYNDNIKYSYYTIKDEYENVLGCYIGFKIPRLTVDFEAESISAYDTASIVNLDSDHNFYDKWKLSVPMGKHGNDFNGLEFADSDNSIWYLRQNYSDSEEGVLERNWLCDLKDIESIQFDTSVSKILVTYSTYYKDEFGNLTDEFGNISRTPVKMKEYINEPVKYLLNAYIDEITQKITLVYSTYEQDEEGYLTSEHEKEVVGDSVKYIKNIDIDPSTKRFKLTYNTKHEEDGQYVNDFEFVGCPIRYVVDLYLNEDTKRMHVVYNTPKTEVGENGDTIYDENGDPKYELNESGEPILEEDIGEVQKVIDRIEYNSTTNEIEVFYNTDPENGISISPSIKYIDHIGFDTTSKRVHAYYNDGTDEYITEAINDIQSMGISKTGHLMVLYGDPNKQGTASFGESNRYVDLGLIRGGGLQIYTTINEESELSQYTSTIPNGYAIAQISNAGTIYWIYDISDESDKKWVQIGTSDQGSSDATIADKSGALPTEQRIGGVVFLSQNRSYYNI